MWPVYILLFCIILLCVCFGIPSAIILAVFGRIEKVKAKKQAQRILAGEEPADFAAINQVIRIMLEGKSWIQELSKSDRHIIEQLRQMRNRN